MPAEAMVARALLLSLLSLVAACTGAADSAEPPTATEPLPVRTVEAQPRRDGRSIIVTGTVRARRETILSFTTAGRLASLAVDEGDEVRAGQLLARLDPTLVGATVAAARARARQANADLERMSTLFAKGWVTRARLDTAEAAAGTSQAEVRAASFDVGAARVTAPSGGVVLRRHVEPGQIVAAGAPVVTVAEAAKGFVLRVPLADGDLEQIRVGQPATVTLAALGGAPLTGSVIEIGAGSDSGTGTFEAEIALPPAPGLRSGLIGDARITLARGMASAGVTVPAIAIFSARAGEGFVYVTDQGRARARLVSVGRIVDAEAEISRGLVPGERVIVTGIERLRNGMPVRPAGQ